MLTPPRPPPPTAEAPKSYVDQISYAVAKKADSMMPGLVDEGELTLKSDAAAAK